MVKRKTLAIVLSSAPYGGQSADHMCRVALRALEKGHAVEIFLYGDGVHAQMSGQSPKSFYPVGAKVQELIGNGAKVFSCRICSEARGYGPVHETDGLEDVSEGKTIDGVRSVDVSDLVKMVSRADKVLSFGGG